MKFLLDENVEYRLAIYLRGQGHGVTAITRDYPRALSDPEVLAIAVAEDRILITHDRDFGALVFRLGLPHAGVIYLRLGNAPAEDKIERLALVLAEYSDHLHESLVVSWSAVRIAGPRSS